MKKRVAVIGMMAGIMAFAVGCSSSVNPDKYVTLGQYKGLEVAKQTVEVTEEEVENEIQYMLEQQSTTEDVKDRTKVEDGDIVNIDYEGKQDGVAFEGGTADAFDLTIGSGTFIPGFEDGIIGKEVGDTFDLDLTFPETYSNNPDLAGKAVVFTVTINGIKKMVVPELDDAFVKSLSADVSTVAEFRDKLKDEILKSKEESAETKLTEDLWNQVITGATVSDDIPADLIEEKTQTMYDNAKKYAESFNMDFSTFLTQYMGLTEDGFADEASKYALDAAKETLILNAIAKAEKLELTKDEIAAAITEYTTLYGYETEDAFKAENDMTAFEEHVLKTKVENFLKENAVISEGAAAPAADAAPAEDAAPTEGTAEEAPAEDAAAEKTAE